MKRACSIALLLAALGTTAASAESDWISDSGNAELKIAGDSWYLDNASTATVRRGTTSSDVEVYYHDGYGTRCGYRKHFIEGGAAVILQPTDSTQSSELCPSGKLNRVTSWNSYTAPRQALNRNTSANLNQVTSTNLNQLTVQLLNVHPRVVPPQKLKRPCHCKVIK